MADCVDADVLGGRGRGWFDIRDLVLRPVGIVRWWRFLGSGLSSPHPVGISDCLGGAEPCLNRCRLGHAAVEIGLYRLPIFAADDLTVVPDGVAVTRASRVRVPGVAGPLRSFVLSFTAPPRAPGGLP